MLYTSSSDELIQHSLYRNSHSCGSSRHGIYEYTHTAKRTESMALTYKINLTAFTAQYDLNIIWYYNNVSRIEHLIQLQVWRKASAVSIWQHRWASILYAAPLEVVHVKILTAKVPRVPLMDRMVIKYKNDLKHRIWWHNECCWHSCSIDASCIRLPLAPTLTQTTHIERRRWTAILKAVAVMHHRRAKHTHIHDDMMAIKQYSTVLC